MVSAKTLPLSLVSTYHGGPSANRSWTPSLQELTRPCSSKMDYAGELDTKAQDGIQKRFTQEKGDAGVLLDGVYRGIPVFTTLDEALSVVTPQVFIIGAVSDGGVLPDGYGSAVTWALRHGLDVVSGLHEFLSDNPLYRDLAEKNSCTITDVRKMFRDYKRFYTGEISQVTSTRVALIGTDSAIGKRTVAVSLVKDLWQRKKRADP